MCRKTAEEQSRIDFASDKAIISISTPNDKPADIDTNNHSIVDILQLSFVDADDDQKDMYPEGWIYTNEQAQQVVDFVLKNKDKIECLWVHCDAGVSRSAGVAAAILKALTGDDSKIFDCKQFAPNMTVYRKTLNAFYNNKTGF